MKDIIIDELIRTKRRTVSLTITNDAKLVVRAPLRLPLKDIEKLILEKMSWIINKKSLVLERLNQTQAFIDQKGERYFFLGEPHILVMQDKVKTITCEDGVLLFPSMYQDRVDMMIKKWYQNQAKTFLPKRLAEIASQKGISYQSCRITSARKRWGSCNVKNNINLSWRLIMANQRAIDYVLIHELCHVIHKNHSKDFWNKVREIMPDFAVHRKWLKDHVFILDVFE